MIQYNDVDKYFKFGRGIGLVHGFYVLDEEFYNVLVSSLPDKYAPYSLICERIYIEAKRFEFYEVSLNEFLSQRKNGVTLIYIKSSNIPFELDLLELNKNNDLKTKNDINKNEKFLSYRGLPELRFGWPWPNRKMEQSYVTCMNKYIRIDEPEHIFHNKQYEEICNALVKGIKKVLKYKSKMILLDGGELISKQNTISECFANDLRKGTSTANVEIVE